MSPIAKDRTDTYAVVGSFAIIALFLTCAAAFVRHIWWICALLMTPLGHVSIGQILLALIGTLFFPIGIVHGFWLWFH